MVQINNTQLTGLIGFGTAALLCLWAVWRKIHARNIWIVLSIGYLMMFVDILTQMRFQIRDVIGDTLKLLGIYEDRRTGQAISIVVTVCVVAFFGLPIFGRMRKFVFSARLAMVAGMLALALTLMEIISLHAIDAILYNQIGPVLLIGWLWLACGLTSAGAVVVTAKTRSQNISIDRT